MIAAEGILRISGYGFNPQVFIPMFGMGYACSAESRLEDAVLWYRRCLRADPSHMAANSNLAEVLVRLNQTDDAIEVCQKALEIYPDDANFHFDLGLLLFRQNRLAEARTILEKGATHNPQDKEIQDLLGTIRKGQDR